MLSSTDFRGHSTTFTYDPTGLVASETQPVTATKSITTSYGYDLAGNETLYTDGNGSKWWTTYNSWNLPECQIEPPTAAYPNQPQHDKPLPELLHRHLRLDLRRRREPRDADRARRRHHHQRLRPAGPAHQPDRHRRRRGHRYCVDGQCYQVTPPAPHQAKRPCLDTEPSCPGYHPHQCPSWAPGCPGYHPPGGGSRGSGRPARPPQWRTACHSGGHPHVRVSDTTPTWFVNELSIPLWKHTFYNNWGELTISSEIGGETSSSGSVTLHFTNGLPDSYVIVLPDGATMTIPLEGLKAVGQDGGLAEFCGTSCQGSWSSNFKLGGSRYKWSISATASGQISVAAAWTHEIKNTGEVYGQVTAAFQLQPGPHEPPHPRAGSAAARAEFWQFTSVGAGGAALVYTDWAASLYAAQASAAASSADVFFLGDAAAEELAA